MPLDIYIDCWIENDLKGLVISGTASHDLLQKTWDKIFLQSLEISQSGKYNDSLEILREIEDCRAKLVIVNTAISHFVICNEQGIDNDQDLIKVLDSMALRSNIKPEDRGDSLIKKLNSVIGRAKKWAIRIDQLRKNLEEIRAENKGAKVDRAYFDNWLDCISSDKGYHVKANDITVSRFYGCVNSILEKSKQEEIKRQMYA